MMKLFLVTVVALASCMLFITGSPVDLNFSTSKPILVNSDSFPSERIFFNSDPCTNAIYSFLNISDVKCSLQCFLQAGLQQGGYCDENSECQCNQISR